MEIKTDNIKVIVDLHDLKRVVSAMISQAEIPTDYGDIIIVLEAMQRIYVGIRAFYTDRGTPDA